MRGLVRLRIHLAVAVVGLVALTGCTVNPVTGKTQLDLLGEAQEIELGKELYPQYTQLSLGEVGEPALQTYVNDVGLSLAAVSHRPELPYHFNAVNDPVVNAYALPGGKISITRGLLARFETEDEMAAVLGHETGHVTARHAAQHYTRAILAQMALVGAAVYMEHEDVKHRDLYMLGGMIGAQAVLARYSREQERQSDELGFQYVVQAGYNPRGMVRVMEVLAAESQRRPNLLERMFASHPLTENRIAAARQRVEAAAPEIVGRPMKRRPYQDRTKLVRSSRAAYDRLAEAQGVFAEGKADQARSLLRQSVDEWPRDGVLRAFLAAAELEADNLRAAMTNAGKAATDAPQVFYPQLVAGQAFVTGKRFPEALARLEAAVTLLPDIPSVLLLRGQALEGMGRRSDAAAQYRRVQELAPDSEAAQEAGERLRRMGMS